MACDGTMGESLITPDSQYSHWLSRPPPGDEVVISGMSGRFPKSKNINEFRDNIFNKRDMLVDGSGRWKLDHRELPKRHGEITNDINKFDAGYFGIHYRQADTMDPAMRLQMELVIEAIMDAGINPVDLKGSKTGVFIGGCFSDTEYLTYTNMKEPQRFALTGYLKSMFAHRLSYYLQLKGPSLIVDTACSSSSNALHSAFKSLRNGQCENAIVAAYNLILFPGSTIQFNRLGVLSNDGVPRVFDENANGYVRAEGCGCIFLQKAKNAKRIYAKVVNVKVNSDGFKKEGITFPSAAMQKELMVEIYEETDIQPSNLSYFEAHSTGTTAGDPEEVNAIDNALGRRCHKQLLIGSVKSNIGHAEPVSGLSSIIKVLLAMETGLIGPNVNFKTVKKGLRGIEEERLKVVTELTELSGENAIVGINNFGFGGSNCHLILQRFTPHRSSRLPNDDIPRLICVSGRTENAVRRILDDITENSLDDEYVGLLHELYKRKVPDHLYRAYIILSKNGVVLRSPAALICSHPNLYVFFGRFVNNFRLIASSMMQFAPFKQTVLKINTHLKLNKSKTLERILEDNTEPCEDILGSMCVQLALVDIFKILELSPTGVFGDYFGKIVSEYYCDVLSLKKAVLAALKFSRLNFDSNMNFATLEKLDCNKTVTSLPKQKILLNVSDSTFADEDWLVKDGVVNILDMLGRLYTNGFLPQVHKLYPEIQFPVSRGISMISPSIEWHHEKSWNTYEFDENTTSDVEQREYVFSYLDKNCHFIKGHVIDGRNLFPATAYLNLVWQALARSHQQLLVTDIPVIFENCRFIRAVTMPKSGYLGLFVMIQKGSGNFEILEKKSVLVTGRVRICEEISEQQVKVTPYGFFDDNQLNVVDQDEIYREFYLRGYNYSGLFKAIQKCKVDGSFGLIKWNDNWSAFMDNMLQMGIIYADTRLLYVPFGIKKITIDPSKHMDIVKSLEQNEGHLPVYVDKNSETIISGGIEMQGLQVRSILKKKARLEPVLEKNQFVPFVSGLELAEAIRVNTQIILENNLEYLFKAVEVLDEFTDSDSKPILNLVYEALEAIPLVIPDLTISSKTKIEETPGIKYETITLTPESNLLLVVVSNILQRGNNLRQIFKSVSTNGFVLTREDVNSTVQENIDDIEVLTNYVTTNERIVMLRRKGKISEHQIIEISSDNFKWIPELQKSINLSKNVITYATNEKPEGILGFINCIRREKNGHAVKCFFIMDDAPEFDIAHPFYSKQIKKNLAINVYKNGSWGSYRHLILEDVEKINCEHSYAYFKSRGDISSFEWMEGPLTENVPLSTGQFLASTFYAAVNFKDIMAASGRVNPEAVVPDRLGQEFLIGFEFSGKDLSGGRIAGITNNQGISSYVAADSCLAWKVPDLWTLEDAATVPVVYCTVIYALLMVGNMKPGSSILIHSATGGIGLAALNVCLHYKCDIFVTVGTKKKRDYLKKHYPEILDSHIGNSRDTSFEQMVNRETKNRGVDFVLNSLADDKLQASIRCLARRGIFLEIGKYDLVNDTSFNLAFIAKGASYHGVLLDEVFRHLKNTESEMFKLIEYGIKTGFVKPLPRVVFNAEQVEEAYRHMMTGNHIGKVLIKIRDEQSDTTSTISEMKIKASPRINCDRRFSYVIIGGLGGVGLELSDWLVLRGAKKLVLVSRSGIQNGYQQQRIRLWRSYGVQVIISIKDVSIKQQCEEMITEANQLGPVDAVFNLAVVLKDALFEDQVEEAFLATLAPKSHATTHLDQLTRKLCPNLRYFVIFSSVSCGRGNIGQSNYGMANSIMERICEKRKQEGLPAVAIQWGAIGEVGLVAKMQKENKELVIGGTLQQKISSCLQVLDNLLRQNHPVVSSMVVAEKRNKNDNLGPVEAVASILGIKDIKTVSQFVTLAELGMDSMMGTEIIQLLEKDFEIYITPLDLRSLTFAKLIEMEAEKMVKTEDKVLNKFQDGKSLLIRYIPDGAMSHLPVRELNNQVKLESAPVVFVLPGMEGTLDSLEILTNSLEARVIGIQYSYENPEDCVQNTAKNIVPHLEKYLSENGSFIIIGYSFGAIIALELTSLLEGEGYSGTLICIEGSPTYLSSSVKTHFTYQDEEEFQTEIIIKILSFVLPLEILSDHKDKLRECKSLEERLEFIFAAIPSEISNRHKLEKQSGIMIYKHMKAMVNYSFTNKKIKSLVYLFKATQGIIDEEEDYQLSKVCEQSVEVATIKGDHATMLSDPHLVENVNKIITLNV